MLTFIIQRDSSPTLNHHCDLAAGGVFVAGSAGRFGAENFIWILLSRRIRGFAVLITAGRFCVAVSII